MSVIKKLLLKTLGERVLVNKLLKYLYTAKILSYEFDCLRAKMAEKLFHFHKFKMNIYIYIYIYVCVCVCVCV